MKQFHQLTLKSFLAAFVVSLSIFIFLLLMQFLMQYINQIAGKGLPVLVILELIFNYFSFILMLAVPMACLVGSMFTAYQIRESKAFTVIQNAGISYVRLIYPMVLMGGLIAAGMWQMNNYINPKANLRSQVLLRDIKQKQPAFALEDNVFYSGIPNYGIRARKITNGNSLQDVILFDNSLGGIAKTVITAKKAKIINRDNYLVLQLEDGEFHQYKKTGTSSYQQITFKKYETAFNTEQQKLKRSDISMISSVKSFNLKELTAQIDTNYQQKARVIKSIKGTIQPQSYSHYEDQIVLLRIEQYRRQVFSIACVLFVLLGFPIGLSLKKGGLAIIGGIAAAILTLYWCILILGEKMIKNDVLKIDPFPAIWGTNFVAIAFVLLATAYFTYGRFWKRLLRGG